MKRLHIASRDNRWSAAFSRLVGGSAAALIFVFVSIPNALATPREFFAHQSTVPVVVPGGVTTRFLNNTLGTGPTAVDSVALSRNQTGSFTVFTAPAFSAPTFVLPEADTVLQMSANATMPGCADISATVNRVNELGQSTSLGTATLIAQTLPQGIMGGSAGFMRFTLPLILGADRLIPVGSSIALNVSVTNRCATRTIFLAYGSAAANTHLTVTPACGNGIVEPGETCDDNNESDGDACPATCRIASCSPLPLQRDVWISVQVPSDATVSALLIYLDYPEGKVALPGAGSQDSVKQRLVGLPPDASAQVNDLNYAVKLASM